jgi:hypothetical protein
MMEVLLAIFQQKGGFLLLPHARLAKQVIVGIGFKTMERSLIFLKAFLCLPLEQD